MDNVVASESVAYETLRGELNNPIRPDEIEALRHSFIRANSAETTGIDYALLDAGESFSNENVISYNIITNGNEGPKEQYVTQGTGSGSKPRTNAAKVEEELHQKADEMLAKGAVELGRSARKEKAESTKGYDIEWSDWWYEGGTDIYKRYPAKSHNWGESRPGNVEFVIDTRSNTEDDRVGARTRVRMEPGRQICNSSDSINDEYCIPSAAYDGWMNRAATIYQDWDNGHNGTPTSDLIESYDPGNDIGDITKTRTVSLGLNLSREPGASIGYSSGVTIPGAEVLDKTTKSTGQTKHQFKVNSTDSNAGLYSTEFEVGSIAEWEPACGSPDGVFFIDIDVDLGWGIPNPFQWPKWQNKSSDGESFKYDKYCSP